MRESRRVVIVWDRDGIEYDVEVSVTPGSEGSRPWYSDPGDPPEPPEATIEGVTSLQGAEIPCELWKTWGLRAIEDAAIMRLALDDMD